MVWLPGSFLGHIETIRINVFMTQDVKSCFLDNEVRAIYKMMNYVRLTGSFDFPSVSKITVLFLDLDLIRVLLNSSRADLRASGVAVRPQFRLMRPMACKRLDLSVNFVKLNSSSTKEAYIVTPIWTWFGPIFTAFTKSSTNVFIFGKSVSFTDEELSSKKITSVSSNVKEQSEKQELIEKG